MKIGIVCATDVVGVFLFVDVCKVSADDLVSVIDEASPPRVDGMRSYECRCDNYMRLCYRCNQTTSIFSNAFFAILCEHFFFNQVVIIFLEIKHSLLFRVEIFFSGYFLSCMQKNSVWKRIECFTLDTLAVSSSHIDSSNIRHFEEEKKNSRKVANVLRHITSLSSWRLR